MDCLCGCLSSLAREQIAHAVARFVTQLLSSLVPTLSFDPTIALFLTAPRQV